MFTVIIIVVIILIILGNSGKPTKNYKDINYYEGSDYSASGQSSSSSSTTTNAKRPVYQVEGGVIRSVRTNMTRNGYPQYWLTVAIHYKQGDFSKFIQSSADEELYQSLRKGDVVNFTFYLAKGKYRNIIDLQKVGHRLFG